MSGLAEAMIQSLLTLATGFLTAAKIFAEYKINAVEGKKISICKYLTFS